MREGEEVCDKAAQDKRTKNQGTLTHNFCASHIALLLPKPKLWWRKELTVVA